jgi:N-acetylneuraminate synthase
MIGPDVAASVTTAEMRQLVEGVRFIEKMRANPVDKDEIAATTALLRNSFMKSVVTRVDLAAGTVLKEEHLTTKKPGTGMPAERLYEMVGKRLQRDLKADELLKEEDLEMSD